MNLRIKDYTTKVGSGVTPKGGAESYLSSGIPLFRSQNVHNFGFLLDDIAYISEEIDEQMSGSRVMPGDVLLNITGASIGRCFYTSDDFKGGNVNQHVCIIRPNQKIVKPAFLHYLLISDKGQMYIDLSQTGANRQGLTIEEIRNFSFDIPLINDQQRIVDYLDKKLVAIDHRLEVLEKEKDAYARLKKSVINQAVTCGLNPDVALKDSGIDWIGMMPKHWAVKRVKDVCKVVCGATPKDNQLYWDGDIIWISPSDMTEFGEIEKGARTITYDGYQSCGTTLVPKNSIIMSTRAPIGKTNIALNEMCTNQGCKCLTSKSLHMRYMLYTIWSKKDNFQALGRGTTFIELSTKDLSLFYLALPPLSEQQAIATYLDEKCAKIDTAIDNINKQIDASKRLKKAIINEAIGGKIQM